MATSDAVDDVARHFLPLVKMLAFKMVKRLPANVEIDDLIQAGMIGLCEAFQRFDVDGGAAFDTFATRRITGAMLDEVRATDSLTISARRWKREMLAAVCKLQQDLLREPTEGEIAAALEMDLPAYRALTSAASIQAMSLGELTMGQMPVFVEADPLVILLNKERITQLVKSAEALPERLNYALRSYYADDLPLVKIAAVLKVSDARVSQLLRNAIVKVQADIKQQSRPRKVLNALQEVIA